MWDEGGRMKLATSRGISVRRNKASRVFRSAGLLLLVLLLSLACNTNLGPRTIPAEVESAISSVSDDIAAERYEKVYNEASELWRQDTTLDQSVSTFKTLRTKLG